MRILLVGPGNNKKYGGGFFYSFNRRLMNGFIRAGHFVYPFSDRDTADYAMGVRPLGRRLANQRLVEIAQDLQPDLTILLLSYLITPETVAKIKARVRSVKVGAICIDDIGHDNPAGQFRYLLSQADFGFATTGGETLATFRDAAPVAFIPNPVDASIDVARAYEAQSHDHDVFFACHQPERDQRWQQIDALSRLLPANVRLGLYGRSRERDVKGAAYIAALGASKVGLNLNRRDGDLYASDRMAHFLGNGLALATPRASGYDAVFGEDELAFFDGIEDLAEVIVGLTGDDEAWRGVARAGRRRAMDLMNEVRVAGFVAEMTAGRDVPSDWPFADHIFEQTG